MAVVVNKAIVKTPSNYRELNGKKLEVVEMNGRRVTCKFLDYESGQELQADFSLSEVQEFITDKKQL